MFSKIFLKNPQITIGNAVEGAYSYLIENICKNDDRDIIFITSDNNRARKLYNEIQFVKSSTALFPEWDTTPYDLISPSKNILEERISTLSKLRQESKNIVITTIGGLLQKTISTKILDKHTLTIKRHDSIDREKLIIFLIENNYTRVSTATEPGEFSVRGGILDIFANGESEGYRLDFFDKQVENLKLFDPGTQTSIKSIEQIRIMPASELILAESYITKFKESLLNLAGTKTQELDLLENLSQGIKPNAIEQFLPLFYETANILEYLDNPIIIFDKFLEKEIDNKMDRIQNLYEERKKHSHLPESILPPNYLWITAEKSKEAIKKHDVIHLELSEKDAQTLKLPISSAPNFKIQAQQKKNDKISLFAQYTKSQYAYKKNVILSALSRGSQDRLSRILKDYGVDHKITETIPHSFAAAVHIIISPIEEGFICPEYAFITESNIFGESIQKLTKKHSATSKNTNSLSSFALGELVVHHEYGIGRFRGLESIELSQSKHDCIKLEYAGEDKLFIPVENINLITKYGSEDSLAQLDSLGSSTWQTKRARAKEKIKKSATYLMQIAAQRQSKKADVLEITPGLYEEFCTTFPYLETEDQENAITAVKEDLSNSRAMDRLVCGDTGFGKTEVAIRAAFIAIKAGKQVALICPTTLLAKQHFKSFKSRLEKFGINVIQMSRLVSARQAKENIETINNGKADLVIGTHALLNDKINFKDIGLLIIDEEQHFGVAQKEKLKKFKENLHILTLSATPIPRTLQMSLTGIKDLSVISTAPVNRMPTKTVIMKFDELVIKEALMKERQRNGQSFYICPRISDLQDIKQLLARIAPTLKVKAVYGRMPPTAIDDIMGEFCDGKFDVLLCTSIIESGIDIPTANTMIVHKSDYFGLSQMYQIKGRIGRSNIEAFAYFTFASNKAIKDTTLNKLEVLQKNSHLGAGFSIASHDMDIRGYGNLVGEEQSGHIRDIGIELYQNMLGEEINKIKSGEKEDPSIKAEFTPQINLGAPVYIPEEYIADFDLRLSLYRKIGEIDNEDSLQAFAAEMLDRFGPLPNELENLLSIITIKNLCYKCGISKIDASLNGFAITFTEGYAQAADKILKFILNRKEKISIKQNNRIIIAKSIENEQERNLYIGKFIRDLIHILS